MNFTNSSVYIVPVCFDSYKAVSSNLTKSESWQSCDFENTKTLYLLEYAQKIRSDKAKYSVFSYKNPQELNIYLYENYSAFSGFEAFPTLSDIRLSVFSTGIAFLEFWINYGSMPIDNIIEFSYRFKKTDYANRRGLLPNGKISLSDAISKILGASNSLRLFFSNEKNECTCFHMIKLQRGEYSQDQLREWSILTQRTYNHTFAGSEFETDALYDMLYTPYRNDYWSGSQEALSNICYEIGDERRDFYFNNYKYMQLTTDYHFLYLLLLNQRYSAIKYIEAISDLNIAEKDLEVLNEKIATLKTSFSFRVISDDKLFQNVYSKMYKILDIDAFLEDLEDNEQKISILRDANNKKTEKLLNMLLFGISLLSIFSALVDAAGYFDRVSFLKDNATLFSFCITIIIILAVGLYWILKKKK